MGRTSPTTGLYSSPKSNRSLTPYAALNLQRGRRDDVSTHRQVSWVTPLLFPELRNWPSPGHPTHVGTAVGGARSSCPSAITGTKQSEILSSIRSSGNLAGSRRCLFLCSKGNLSWFFLVPEVQISGTQELFHGFTDVCCQPLQIRNRAIAMKRRLRFAACFRQPPVPLGC